MCEPTASFGRSEQICQRGVERGRFLRWNVVTRARDNQQACGWHRAFEKYAAVDAWFIFVTDDHQEWRREALERRLHLPQRRAFELQIEHGLRVPLRGMLGQHARKFGVPARIA